MIIGIVVCCVWALFLITGAFVLLLLAFAFSISGIYCYLLHAFVILVALCYVTFSIISGDIWALCSVLALSLAMLGIVFSYSWIVLFVLFWALFCCYAYHYHVCYFGHWFLLYLVLFLVKLTNNNAQPH